MCYRWTYSDAVLSEFRTSGFALYPVRVFFVCFFVFCFFFCQRVLGQCLKIRCAYRAGRLLFIHPLLRQAPLLPTAPCYLAASWQLALLSGGRAGRGAADPLQSGVLPAGMRALLPSALAHCAATSAPALSSVKLCCGF